jgi:hypothetical protein
MATIEIRTRNVGGTLDRAQHLYFVYISDNPKVTRFLRGGPASNNPIFGDIVAIDGLYVEDTPDYTPINPTNLPLANTINHVPAGTTQVSRTIWSGTDVQMQAKIAAAKVEMNTINQEKFDYQLPALETILPAWPIYNNQNSNTVANYLARAMGLELEVDQFIHDSSLNVPGYTSTLTHNLDINNNQNIASRLALRLLPAIYESGLSISQFAMKVSELTDQTVDEVVQGSKDLFQELLALSTGSTNAHSWGDPHLRTVDGISYDFQIPGEYVLIASRVADFQIQARNELIPGSTSISYNTAIATSLNGTKVGLYLPPRTSGIIYGSLGDDNLGSTIGTTLVLGGQDTGIAQLATSISITFINSSGSYSNSFGYYVKDENGNPISGKIILANTRIVTHGDILNYDIDAPKELLGFFLIPNGYNHNIGITNDDSVTFKQINGTWAAFKNDIVLISEFTAGNNNTITPSPSYTPSSTPIPTAASTAFVQNSNATMEGIFCETSGGVGNALAQIYSQSGGTIIACGSGKQIAINFALYGRESTSICLDPLNRSGTTLVTNCIFNVTNIISPICTGYSSCDMVNYRSSSAFGGVDPCFGTYKYVTVNYSCISNSTVIPSFTVSSTPSATPSATPYVTSVGTSIFASLVTYAFYSDIAFNTDHASHHLFNDTVQRWEDGYDNNFNDLVLNVSIRETVSVIRGDVLVSSIQASNFGYVMGSDGVDTIEDFSVSKDKIIFYDRANSSIMLIDTDKGAFIKTIPANDGTSGGILVKNVAAANLTSCIIFDNNTIIQNSPLYIGGYWIPIKSDEMMTVSGGLIYYKDNRYTITTEGGDSFIANIYGYGSRNGRIDIQLSLSTNRQTGTTYGLLGSNDGNSLNDLALRDGTVLGNPITAAILYGPFANDWRVIQENSLFTYTDGQNSSIFTDSSFSKRYVTAKDFSADEIVLAQTKAIAAGYNSTSPLFNDILLELLVGGINITEGIVGITEHDYVNASSLEVVEILPTRNATNTPSFTPSSSILPTSSSSPSTTLASSHSPTISESLSSSFSVSSTSTTTSSSTASATHSETSSTTVTPSFSSVPTQSVTSSLSASSTTTQSLTGTVTPSSTTSLTPGTTVSNTFTISKTSLPTFNSSSSIMHSVTASPNASINSFAIVQVNSSGAYVGTNEAEDFIIDTPGNVSITGGNGSDKFTLKPRPNAIATIIDFDKDHEVVDLSAFRDIRNMNDFRITQGSAVINLPENQKVILQNLQPSDVSSDNFIFSSPNLSSDQGINLPAIIGGVIGGTVVLAVGIVVGYAIWRSASSLPVAVAALTNSPAVPDVTPTSSHLDGVNPLGDTNHAHDASNTLASVVATVVSDAVTAAASGLSVPATVAPSDIIEAVSATAIHTQEVLIGSVIDNGV